MRRKISGTRDAVRSPALSARRLAGVAVIACAAVLIPAAALAAGISPAPLASVAAGMPEAAQPGMTITVGAATLTNRILVTVPVTIVCAPLTDPSTALDDVSVSIEQASGRTVSTGSGEVSGGPFSNSGGQPFLTCDGSTQNIVAVIVLPGSGSGPFHGGPAIFTISATHASGSCTPFCQETGSESAQFGPASVSIKG